MAKVNAPLLAFNRGLVSALALARVDLKRMAMSAAVMVNWMPRVLGSMMLRPGLGYLGSTLSNLTAVGIPFIFSSTDTAIVEVTNAKVRVWVSDALITRGSVSSAVTNGNFDANVASWTDNDEAGATSQWITGGYLGFASNGTSAGIRDQTVTVAPGDIGDEHALRIVIQRGPVTLRVGSTAGGDEYISETELQTGTHSLAFTPSGDFRVRFLSRLERQVLVSSCNVESSGVMEITAPWLEADLRSIRFDQSGDVLFVACDGYQQQRIERRAAGSWSVVNYYADDGPFLPQNVGPITMYVGDTSGNTSMTASAPYFKSTNVGSLFKINPPGQSVTAQITAENQFTAAIRVTGVDNDRIFTVLIAEDPIGAATFTLQRSNVSETGPWVDVQQWTADVVTSFDDTLDNQILWYRLGVKTGDYGSGTDHFIGLEYTQGSITGIARVLTYSNSQSVDVEILQRFGQSTSSSATDEWSEGQWSDRRGWPTSVALHEGRLCWAGRDAINLSVSDDYHSFDEEFEGDAGPISRSIGSGPVDNINWILSQQRLILGGQGAEFSVRSSSLDEPLTPTNLSIKPASTLGSAGVPALKIDQRAVFVQRGGIRVHELQFGDYDVDYAATHLTSLVPEIGEPSIIRTAVQRQPDTRIHCVRSDGTVAVAILEPIEEVLCWVEVETDGEVEDVLVLPGTTEDAVYYFVKRTINGSTVRYLEKWALESECRGSTLNKQADAFISVSQASSTTITGLSHLEGESVVVWANGKDLGTKTVSSSQITGLSEAVTTAIVGLTYSATWKSTKLGSFIENGLLAKKIITQLGVILGEHHPQGLEYGPDFTTMDQLPLTEKWKAVDTSVVRTSYDEELFTFPGTWDTDSRLCLKATAPKPCTVLAAVMAVESHGKS